MLSRVMCFFADIESSKRIELMQSYYSHSSDYVEAAEGTGSEVRGLTLVKHRQEGYHPYS